MQNLFIEFIFLIIVILALVMIANKLGIAYPIVLVIGGVLLNLTSAYKMNHRAEFDEELIRKYLSLIDLEEHKVREKIVEEVDIPE